MPFFSDYGYYHHGPSVPFSSQYYSQLLQPYPAGGGGSHHHLGVGGGGGRPVPRVQPRNYNSIVVEQTLRAIRRGPAAAAATRHHRYAPPHRPVHINAAEIDVTSPRPRPARRPTAAPEDGEAARAGGIQRGRTVVRLHTVHRKSPRAAETDDVTTTRQSVSAAAAAAAAAAAPPPLPPPPTPTPQSQMPAVPEEELPGTVAKKGTIKRHTSAGIKVPADGNDDRRPSAVTDEILREQEALFDTMIMEEMEGGGVQKKPRRKSYPADVVAAAAADGGKKKPSRAAARKKSAAGAALFGADAARATSKKTVVTSTAGAAAAAAAAAAASWKLNYDVIIEESGVEPVSFTFRLNKARQDGDGNGKRLVDANHNVVVGPAHDNDDRRAGDVSKKKHVKVVKKVPPAVDGDNGNDRADNGVGVLLSGPAQTKAKKKVIVKKKVVKKKEAGPADVQPQQQQQQPARPPQTPSPADSKSKKKKKKPSPAVSKTATTPIVAAVAAPAVITPFVRASFGKTFISPSQVSSTKSKFEKPKPKAKPEEQPAPVEPAPVTPPARESPALSDDDDDDDESSTDDSSSVCSGNGTGSSDDSSTYFYSDEYGDKRIACSVSSFDSGLPSSPVPAPDPIDCDVNCHRKCEKLMPNLCGVNQKLVVEALATLKRDSSSSSDTAANSYQIGGGTADGTERPIRSYSYRHHSRPKRVVPPATSIPRFRKYAVEDFNFLKVLGKGSFGKVLLAELKGTDYYYAVKCLKKDVVLEDDDVECTLIERKVLALGTNHPYLCHLFCTFQTESHLFFVMEYLNGGDLMFHIQQSGRFDEGRSRFYAAEIVSGLKFLHKKGIVYRDLKLDNILLDFNGHVRIADFGMCKLQIYLDKTADTFCGTPDYMAPEIIKGQKYNQSVDWWSFGILLYEMLVGKSPFSGCDEDALFWSICNEQPQYPRYLSVDAKSVLVALLEKDAVKRLGSLEANHSAEDVIRHSFFSSMDWCKLERRELEPPYMPRVYHPLDTHYFDKHFTKEKPRLTPVDKTILQSMDQSQFDGFTYTNPNVTDS